MPFRCLHIADLHLDTAVGGRTPELRAIVRAAVHSAFENALERALQGEVQAVLIAGDAFDDPLLTQATAAVFRAGLLRLAAAGITVAWCTGNHDPGAGTVRGRPGRAALLGLDDPARHGHPLVHVFRSHRPATIAVRAAHGAVTGTITSIGHTSDCDTENLARRLARPAGEAPAVALLHTQVDDTAGTEDHARYAPCARRDLVDAGFDYWALGHVHVRGRVPGTVAWYAGNPQGRNAKETGARGGLLIEVEKGEPPRVEPVDFCALRFETVRLAELESLHHPDELTARLASALGTAKRLPTLLRVELAGATPLADSLRRPEQRAEAESALALALDVLDVELCTTDLRPVRDHTDFHNTPSALREAHRLLGAAAAQDALLSVAELEDVELSPEAPPPGSPDRAAYVRRRLVGAADELLARALSEGQR